jgi:integrase
MERLFLGKPLTEDDFVFAHPDGTPLNPDTVTHAFGKLVRKAGLPQLRLHDLRHSHATLMFKEGIHPKIVQERLGHSNIATTLNIYSHVLPGLQEAAVERFDKLLARENVGKMSAKDSGADSGL